MENGNDVRATTRIASFSLRFCGSSRIDVALSPKLVSFFIIFFYHLPLCYETLRERTNFVWENLFSIVTCIKLSLVFSSSTISSACLFCVRRCLVKRQFSRKIVFCYKYIFNIFVL